MEAGTESRQKVKAYRIIGTFTRNIRPKVINLTNEIYHKIMKSR